MNYQENVALYGEVAAAKIAAASDVLTLINYVKFGNKADAQTVYEDLGEILGVNDSASESASTSESASASTSEPVSESESASETATSTPSNAANVNQTNSGTSGVISTK